MKSGRSIQDVSREILRQQEAKADYLVATDRLHMDTYGDSPVIRVLDREGIDQIEPLEIQQTAHQHRSAPIWTFPASIMTGCSSAIPRF